jgi:hypothetical protein
MIDRNCIGTALPKAVLAIEAGGLRFSATAIGERKTAGVAVIALP